MYVLGMYFLRATLKANCFFILKRLKTRPNTCTFHQNYSIRKGHAFKLVLPVVTDQVPKTWVLEEIGLKQVEQGFYSFFAK